MRDAICNAKINIFCHVREFRIEKPICYMHTYIDCLFCNAGLMFHGLLLADVHLNQVQNSYQLNIKVVMHITQWKPSLYSKIFVTIFSLLCGVTIIHLVHFSLYFTFKIYFLLWLYLFCNCLVLTYYRTHQSYYLMIITDRIIA